MDGILPLHKPRGMTSHDCVAKVRKILKTKKVGHTGTLDPDVNGVLPLCIGRATKVVEYMTNHDKTYEAAITIGSSTTTEDASGEIIEQKEINENIDKQQIEDVLLNFLGEIKQTPPMYSAVKIKGKRLYEYAREGIEVDRPTRNVTIKQIKLLDQNIVLNNGNKTFHVRVTCSKGTYIRTLAVDIGIALGYPAHMSNLTRIASGGLLLEDCLTFDEIEARVQNNNLSLIPIEYFLQGFISLVVDTETEKKVLNGAVLYSETTYEETERIAVYNNEGSCLAIYKQHPNKKDCMKPEKVLIT